MECQCCGLGSHLQGKVKDSLIFMVRRGFATIVVACVGEGAPALQNTALVFNSTPAPGAKTRKPTPLQMNL